METPAPDLELIRKAGTSEALGLISKQDSVLTWLGPSTILLLFLTVVMIISLSLGWYLSNEVTEGWLLFEAGFVAFLCVVLFLLYYAIVNSAGKFVLSHIRRT